MAPIATVLINAITSHVMASLMANARIPVDTGNATVVAPTVEKAVEQAVVNNPQLQHVTNTEPAIQSRVTWGAVFAILGGVATIGTHIVMGVPITDLNSYGPPLMAIGGGAYTIYGRWVATKPLFTR